MDGIILINKEKEMTSHDVVNKVKKIFNEKTGHTGTLDPNATGVLPILLGKGTKISKYLINHDKTYEVILKLGIKTDTGDSEGKIIEEKNTSEESMKKDYIETVLNSFVGKQQQIPPMYSAIKIKGKKLYEYARNGESVERTPRNIEIYEINLLGIDSKNCEISFEVKCSKGTYIRTLCEDIAVKCGTVGYMKELKRTRVGEFSIKDAITIKELEKNIDNKEYLIKHFINIEQLFKESKKIDLDDRQLKMFLNGVKIKNNFQDGTYRIYNKKKFIGLGSIIKTELKRDVIIEN